MVERQDPGVRYEGLPDESKKKACERHNIWYVKNIGGDEYCPVCVVESRMQPGPTVYLAGSVQFVDGGKTWRRKIMDDYPDINWINPYDSPFTWNGDELEAFIWCRQQVLRSDYMLIRYEHGEETWGTPFEMAWAWESGIPIFAWDTTPRTEIPNFLLAAADVIDPRLEDIIKREIQR